MRNLVRGELWGVAEDGQPYHFATRSRALADDEAHACVRAGALVVVVDVVRVQSVDFPESWRSK